MQYLDSLVVVERRSVERIERCEVFKGVRCGDAVRVAREAVRRGDVRLRKGWEACVLGRKWGQIGVVSVAWSGRFVAGVLRACAAAPMMGDIDVRANEILEDGSGLLDRYWRGSGRGVWTAGDKMRVMREMVDSFVLSTSVAAEGEDDGEELRPTTMSMSKPWTIYIGDSPTDLGCLVDADVGICIRDGDGVLEGEQEALREVLDRVGVGCLHVGEFTKWSRERRSNAQRRLWWARDFEEVRENGVLDGLGSV